MGAGRHRQSVCSVFRPHLIESPNNTTAQQRARFLRLRSVHAQGAVKQSDIGGHLRQLRALRIVGALSRGDQQAENKGSHRPDQSHPQFHDQMWSKDAAYRLAMPTGGEILYEKVQALSPKNDAQRSIQSQALSVVVDIGKTRLLMYEQAKTAVSRPLLVVLVLWLTIIFISFGLFAPFNVTAVSSLFLAALSVSGAIFLILEMYTPYVGVVQISDAPLRSVLANLGR